MRQSVLRQGLQRSATTAYRAVQVQVSLVLLRAVSKLHGRGMDHGLQITNETLKRGDGERKREK